MSFCPDYGYSSPSSSFHADYHQTEQYSYGQCYLYYDSCVYAYADCEHMYDSHVIVYHDCIDCGSG